MGWVAPVLGVASTLFSASQQNKAAKSQQQAAQQGIALQQQMFNQLQQNLQPYMQYGQGAGGLGGLASLMGGNYSGFENSPDYVYARDEMMGGLEHLAAARGSLRSGGTGLDMARHLNGLASQNLNNYRNALMWGANLGQNAAAGVGQSGQAMANSVSGLLQNGANAAASGYGGNAAAGFGIAGLLGNYFQPKPPQASSTYGTTPGYENWGQSY